MSGNLKSVVADATVNVSNADISRSRRYRDSKKQHAKRWSGSPDPSSECVSNPDSQQAGQSIDHELAAIDIQIGKRLRQQRKFRYPFHTQEDIALVLGTSRATVVALEKGTRKLTAAELVLLAEWWRIDVRELLP
jgi:DNA-binding XRE family transcriptional regulator